LNRGLRIFCTGQYSFCATGIGLEVAEKQIFLWKRFAFWNGLNIVRASWNQLLPKDRHLFKKPRLAPFGGARVARRRSSRSVTARTKAPASGRAKWILPKRKPSRGAVASTRKTTRFAMAVMAICREMLNRLTVKIVSKTKR
jgi:hypothetical protein